MKVLIIGKYINHLVNRKSWIYLCQLILGVLFSIFSLRVFNVSEKGELLYLVTISSLIVGVFSFGFSNYVPIYFDRERFDINVYNKLILYSLIISMVGLITWIFFLYNKNELLTIIKIYCFVFYGVIIYLKSINDTILQLINNSRVLALYILIPPVFNLIIIAWAYLNITNIIITPLYFFLSFSITIELLTNLFAYLFLKNYKYSIYSANFNDYFKESIKLYPSNLFSIVSKKLDVLVLGKLGSTSLGNYGVIVSVREIIMVFFRVVMLEQVVHIKNSRMTWFLHLKSIFPLVVIMTLMCVVIVFGFEIIKNDSFLNLNSILPEILFFIFSYLLYYMVLNFLQSKMLHKKLFFVNILLVVFQAGLLLVDFNLTTFLLFNSIYYFSVFILFTLFEKLKFSTLL